MHSRPYSPPYGLPQWLTLWLIDGCAIAKADADADADFCSYLCAHEDSVPLMSTTGLRALARSARLEYRLTHSFLPRTAPLKFVRRPQTARGVRIDGGMSTTYRIYALTEPGTTAARYVGQTAQGLGQRLDDHLRVRGTSARSDWLRSLIARGERPEILLLDQVTGTRRDAYTRETQWIRKLRAEGHPLLNVP